MDDRIAGMDKLLLYSGGLDDIDALLAYVELDEAVKLLFGISDGM